MKINSNFKTLWLASNRPQNGRAIQKINQMAEKTMAPFHIAWIGFDTIWLHQHGVIGIAYNAIPDVLCQKLKTDVVIASGFCESGLRKFLSTLVVSCEAEKYIIHGIMDGVSVATLIEQLTRIDLKGCSGRVSQDRIRITGGSDLDLSISRDGSIHLVVQGLVALRRIV